MQNAFVTASSLASLSTGVALATTPGGNGTVPQTEINTLANVLARCINSTGPAFASCATLFSDAKSGGTSGTTPTDTATAAINMAHNPASNWSARSFYDQFLSYQLVQKRPGTPMGQSVPSLAAVRAALLVTFSSEETNLGPSVGPIRVQ